MEDLDLTCPITLEIFKDPVRLVGDRSNTVFERQAIEEWLKSHETVPTTGEEIGMAGRKIVEDMEMRRRLQVGWRPENANCCQNCCKLLNSPLFFSELASRKS